ncbi:hypothetical protein ACU635_43900 [[Actinomadura] parvosata]|uniref:hypothetical protein n=1 Tax=[Actinomadura] parvosata TaxID=1955412 RepID=UPI00406C33E2
MPYLTLGSNPTVLRIIVQDGNDTRPSPVDEDDELIPPPRPGHWALTLIDDDNLHLLAIEEGTADDLAAFLTRLTVQATAALRAAGLDLPGRIATALTATGDDDTPRADQPEGSR